MDNARRIAAAAYLSALVSGDQDVMNLVVSQNDAATLLRDVATLAASFVTQHRLTVELPEFLDTLGFEVSDL